MKKFLILSVAAVAVLFVSLAINTNVKNTSGSVDLKASLQSANAVTHFVHDCPDKFDAWGYSGLSESSTEWWNVSSVYVGISVSQRTGQNVGVYAYKPACLFGGEEACSNSQLTQIGTITIDGETGQTTSPNMTKIYGKSGFAN
jgi:hypothetical protein